MGQSDSNIVYRILGTEWVGDQMIRIYRECVANGNTHYSHVASKVCGDQELYEAIKHQMSCTQILIHEVVLHGVLNIIEGNEVHEMV